MSKTSQENKAKKAVVAQEETKVTAKVAKKSRKASDSPAVAGEAVETAVTEVVTETVNSEDTPVAEEASKARVTRVRGKRYLAARKKVDPNKLYDLKTAVKLVKEVSLSKFEGKIEAHVTVLDIGNAGEIVFPHLDLGAKKIVVLNDTILAELKDGKINFDVVVATPATMPKLLAFAKLLGPRGLMPNPKNGTLTDKPEEAIKKLSVAKTVIKTEKKAPVVHMVIAKVSQPEAEIEANVLELIKVIKASKIKKLALCPTMGPSVKILIEK